MRYAAVASVVASLVLAAGASAQLEGTVMSVEQDFKTCLTQGEYTYGESMKLASNQDPNRTWTISGPAKWPGYENSVLCDYTGFNIITELGAPTYFFLDQIDEAPENVQAFNSDGKKIGQSLGVDGDGFAIEISVADILAGSKDQMIVAWDTVGGPDCYADINADGKLDLFDFLEFTNLFNDHDFAADCEANEKFDLFNFLCFTNEFNAGC